MELRQYAFCRNTACSFDWITGLCNGFCNPSITGAQGVKRALRAIEPATPIKSRPEIDEIVVGCPSKATRYIL